MAGRKRVRNVPIYRMQVLPVQRPMAERQVAAAGRRSIGREWCCMPPRGTQTQQAGIYAAGSETLREQTEGRHPGGVW